MDLGRLYRMQNDLPSAERTFAEFVRLEPEDAIARYLLGLTQRDAGDSAEALRTLEIVARLDPTLPGPLNDIAWILAAHPDAAIRDPERAVQYGKRAVALSGGRSPQILGTLAAAHAAAGDFEAALETGRAARDAARASRQPTAIFERHLQRYRARKSVVDRSLSVDGPA